MKVLPQAFTDDPDKLARFEGEVKVLAWSRVASRRKANSWVVLCACAVLLSGCREPGEPASQVRESIYFNGDIVTMNDRQPEAEAVMVVDGRIVMVGDSDEAEALADSQTRRIDLAGATLLPGFFDSHSHVTATAAKLALVNADPPPAGTADSIVSIQRALRERLESARPEPGEWLVGSGYDHSMLAEGRHPTRFDLDEVSVDVPVMLRHFSGHQVVVNSKALELAGVSAETEDPPGGRILRLPDSREPNGILQESAQGVVRRLSAGFDVEPGDDALQRMDSALKEYAAHGFTTVTNMGGSGGVLREMARQQRLPLDVIAAGSDQTYSAEYVNRFRVGGSKMILDGGSPGRSAYLRDPYFKQQPGEQGYRGYPRYGNQEEIDAQVEAYYRAGTPVHIHALGDAAVAQAIAAVQAAEAAVPGDDRRTQLIHVQQAQEDQLDTLSTLDVTLTFQVAHNYYFGDFHHEVIYGPERTARLNPARSALDRGLSVTIHHDAPIHPVDQMMLIWASVNRVTRSGKVIGPEQRISVMEALKASTLNAAYQFFEEDSKGSIEVGKLADFVVLSDNPLKVDPMTLKDIQVIETIKEDTPVLR